MNSIEAAEAYLESENNKARTFDLDELARSGMARSIGFPFAVTIEHNRFICTDNTNGYKTTAFYKHMDEKAVKRLVRALTRLKANHDKANI